MHVPQSPSCVDTRALLTTLETSLYLWIVPPAVVR